MILKRATLKAAVRVNKKKKTHFPCDSFKMPTSVDQHTETEEEATTDVRTPLRSERRVITDL